MEDTMLCWKFRSVTLTHSCKKLVHCTKLRCGALYGYFLLCLDTAEVVYRKQVQVECYSQGAWNCIRKCCKPGICQERMQDKTLKDFLWQCLERSLRRFYDNAGNHAITTCNLQAIHEGSLCGLRCADLVLLWDLHCWILCLWYASCWVLPWFKRPDLLMAICNHQVLAKYGERVLVQSISSLLASNTEFAWLAGKDVEDNLLFSLSGPVWMICLALFGVSQFAFCSLS